MNTMCLKKLTVCQREYLACVAAVAWRILLRVFLVLLAIAVIGLSVSEAHAEPVQAPNAFNRFMEQVTGQGKQTLTFGTNGQPVASPGVPTLSTDGTASARVDASGSFRNPSGNYVPATATGRVPPAKAAAAIGKALGKIASGVTLIGAAFVVGDALYDLVKELGYDASATPEGALVMTKATNQNVYAGVCSGGNATAAVLTERCRLLYKGFQSSNGFPNCVMNAVATDGPSSSITITLSVGANCSAVGYTPIVASLITVMPPGSIPATNQEFIDAVAARSGWPSTSNLARALEHATAVTGDKLDVDPASVTVSGPTTSPGPTTSTTKADGTTDTTTVTHNHTYQGDTITTTTVTTTNNYNPVTNTTTTVSNTTGPPAAEPKPVETCGLPGKPACKIDETGTPTTNDFKTEDQKTALDHKEASLSEITNPSGKDTSWGVMPSWITPGGCEPWHIYSLPAPLNASVDVDLCPVKPYADGVSNLIWVAFTFFGITGLVFATMTARAT